MAAEAVFCVGLRHALDTDAIEGEVIRFAVLHADPDRCVEVVIRQGDHDAASCPCGQHEPAAT